jgi:hypothetical protein
MHHLPQSHDIIVFNNRKTEIKNMVVIVPDQNDDASAVVLGVCKFLNDNVVCTCRHSDTQVSKRR